MVRSAEQVVIKRYANRRLYNPATGTYLSRSDIFAMARRSEDFIIIDAVNGDDVTSSLRPILIER